jgi:hypothetical protein
LLAQLGGGGERDEEPFVEDQARQFLVRVTQGGKDGRDSIFEWSGIAHRHRNPWTIAVPRHRQPDYSHNNTSWKKMQQMLHNLS